MVRSLVVPYDGMAGLGTPRDRRVGWLSPLKQSPPRRCGGAHIRGFARVLLVATVWVVARHPSNTRGESLDLRCAAVHGRLREWACRPSHRVSESGSDFLIDLFAGPGGEGFLELGLVEEHAEQVFVGGLPVNDDVSEGLVEHDPKVLLGVDGGHGTKVVPFGCGVELLLPHALLAVEEREAKLLALDLDSAPVVTAGHLDREIERRVGEIERLDAPRPPDPWERPDWTPAERVADDVHRCSPSAEIVRLPRRGDPRRGPHQTQ